MSTEPMSDVVSWPHYLFALSILLVLLGGLGLFGLAVRKGWIFQGMTGLRPFMGERKRLAVTETLVIDPRRRLVILRTDETEHVVLLGAEQETILSSQPVTEPAVIPGHEAEAV